VKRSGEVAGRETRIDAAIFNAGVAVAVGIAVGAGVGVGVTVGAGVGVALPA
jgi:hypothetical protein